MDEPFQERRRSPRASVGGWRFTIGRRIRARVLDISGRGVLLAAEEALPVGTTGRLRVSLGGAGFEGELRVVREERAGPLRKRVIGAAVAPSGPRHQEALDGFLRRAGN